MSPYQVQSPAAPPFSPHHAPSPVPSPSPGQPAPMHSPAPSPARSAPSPKSSPMPPSTGRPNVYAVGINNPGGSGGGSGLKGGSPWWTSAQVDITSARQPLLLDRLWSVDDDATATGAREDLAELMDYLGEVMWTNMMFMEEDQEVVRATIAGSGAILSRFQPAVFAVGLTRQRTSGTNCCAAVWQYGRILGGNPDSLPGANGTQTTSAANASSSSSGDFGGSSFNVDGDVAEPGGVDSVDDVDVTASVFVVQFDDDNNSPNSALVSQPGGVSDPEQTSEQPEQASETASEQADQDQEEPAHQAESHDEPSEQVESQPDHPDQGEPTTFVAAADVAVDDHNYFNTPSLPTADDAEAEAECEAQPEQTSPITSGDQSGIMNINNNTTDMVSTNSGNGSHKAPGSTNTNMASVLSASSPTQAISGGFTASPEGTQPPVCPPQTQETTSSLFVIADQNQNVTGLVQGSCGDPLEEEVESPQSETLDGPLLSSPLKESPPATTRLVSEANGRRPESTPRQSSRLGKTDVAGVPQPASVSSEVEEGSQEQQNKAEPIQEQLMSSSAETIER
ncbi:hypothetical protein BIW11_07410, partial [Tropilaelaps mercedesae]